MKLVLMWEEKPRVAARQEKAELTWQRAWTSGKSGLRAISVHFSDRSGQYTLSIRFKHSRKLYIVLRIGSSLQEEEREPWSRGGSV